MSQICIIIGFEGLTFGLDLKAEEFGLVFDFQN